MASVKNGVIQKRQSKSKYLKNEKDNTFEINIDTVMFWTRNVLRKSK